MRSVVRPLALARLLSGVVVPKAGAGVAPFGLRVPAFPARALEHFRPVVKWVSRWVSPGGGAGATRDSGSGLET